MNRFTSGQRKFLLSIHLMILLAAIPGCKHEGSNPLTEAPKEKPDLSISYSKLTQSDIKVGDLILVESAIKNLELEDEERHPAMESSKGIRAYYRSTPNGPWEQTTFNSGAGNTFVIIEPTKVLSEGETEVFEENFEFTREGYYMFQSSADEAEVVEEESETNNEALTEPGTLQGKPLAKGGFFSVQTGGAPSAVIHGLPVVIHHGRKGAAK